MKKKYEKPMVEMEQFMLDMHIAAPSSDVEWYWTLRNDFDLWYGGENIGADVEVEFARYLEKANFDNSTSGFCYHTNVRPS